MGSYLNPGSALFQKSLQSRIYVDKSRMIEVLNQVINTEERYICVSRPRRFGKTMAANMLAAYYGCGENTQHLFDTLKIGRSDSYHTHLNCYDVIRVNMQDFLSEAGSVDEMLNMLKQYLSLELTEHFQKVGFRNKGSLIQIMRDIYAVTGRAFVILIDEWDCLFREYEKDREAQKKYLDFLRLWLKDKEYVGLAYMTGILPIKKYGSHSALNMFAEYSMVNPRKMAEYFGFTEAEVYELCEKYHRSYEETQAWYDGYDLVESDQDGAQIHSMYSPKSVVEAMLSGSFDNYWNQTESYEALKIYIQMNFDGLKDAVIQMLAGESVKISTGTFENDMTTFVSRDDVLTLLVHLGYLSYHRKSKCVSIPNKEVAQEYVNAVGALKWSGVISSINDSQKLLQALWNGEEAVVAEGIEKVHEEIAVLQYNDENSLSCTISLAFYAAREYYTIVREFPTGKGFADICLIPRRRYADKPAVIIELKWNHSAEGAIAQIKEKHYVQAFSDYRGDMLLAGIIYNKKTKKHECRIETIKID